MFKPLADRPWIWIVAGFLAMLAAMVAAVVICETHKPEPVPLDTPHSWTPSPPR
jgi:hypothetical protein